MLDSPYTWVDAKASHQSPCEYARERWPGSSEQQVSLSDQALSCSLCLACPQFSPNIYVAGFQISQAPWPVVLRAAHPHLAEPQLQFLPRCGSETLSN